MDTFDLVVLNVIFGSSGGLVTFPERLFSKRYSSYRFDCFSIKPFLHVPYDSTLQRLLIEILIIHFC